MKHFHSLKIGIFLLLISTGSFGQKTYLDLIGGYGFPMASQSLVVTDGNSNTEDKLIKGTFGNGMNFGLGFGLKLANQIGIELGASYFNSSTIKSHDETIIRDATQIHEYEFSSSMFRLIPAFRLSTTHRHLNAYAKVGFLIGLNGYFEEIFINKYHSTYPSYHNDEFKIKSEYKGRLSTGFEGSLGFMYNVSQSFSFFIEANGIAHSWAPKKSKITECTDNGTDILGSFTISEREIEYENQITETINPPDNEPTKSLKMYVPLSAIFINVGIQLRFGGDSKKKDAAAPQKN